jgi:putative heme iron utilization protein
VDDVTLLRTLLREQRVLALGVVVDGAPYVGLLPFVMRPAFDAALIHASTLAKHTEGLTAGAPFSALVHVSNQPDGDPLQVPRVTLTGTVERLDTADAAYEEGRALYLARFPGSEVTFRLGDFNLYALHVEGGRLVAGFGRARNLTPRLLAEAAGV